LWGWVDGDLNLGLATVIDRQTFQKKCTKTGSGTTTKGVVDNETLQTSAVIGEFTQTIEDEVDDFFTDRVVTTGVIVGSIFLTRDLLFGVEQ
jgi:hypothetical protein